MDELMIKPGDTFTKDGWMNVARPTELQQFRLEKDGVKVTPIYTKEDLATIDKMNKARSNG